jgi:hypothetical protein
MYCGTFIRSLSLLTGLVQLQKHCSPKKFLSGFWSEKKPMSRWIPKDVEIKISTTLSRVTGPVELNEMLQYSEGLTLYSVIIHDDSLLWCLKLLFRTLLSLCIFHHALRFRRKCVQSHNGCKSVTVNAVLRAKLQTIDFDHSSVTVEDELFSKVVSSRSGIREYGITTLGLAMGRREDVETIDE